VRFIVHFEFDPKDTDKVLEDWGKERNGPKHVFPAQYTGNGTGFFIVETDDCEQWTNGWLAGFPYVEYTPIACCDLEIWTKKARERKK
jgi:hypothetical protein